MLNSSIWPIDKTLSGATTHGQSGPVRNSNEGVLCISQSSSITGALLSDCLVLYLEQTLDWVLPPAAEMQSVYSTALADWDTLFYGKEVVTTFCRGYS